MREKQALEPCQLNVVLRKSCVLVISAAVLQQAAAFRLVLFSFQFVHLMLAVISAFILCVLLVFPRPWYQEDEVTEYLRLVDDRLPHNISAPFYNPRGRAYPDISTFATQYPIVLEGKLVPVSGTSASAPVLAAMIALLNDMRFAANLPPVGFVNPLLYDLSRSNPEAFTDVVFGDNRCGISETKCCQYVFHVLCLQLYDGFMPDFGGHVRCAGTVFQRWPNMMLLLGWALLFSIC